jgi:hypothetical protein
MKKLLLSVALLATTFNSFSQELRNENFESLTVGEWDPVTTDFVTLGGSATNFQVVDDSGNKAFEINDIGAPTDDLIYFFAGIDWASEANVGNDVIRTTFDLYTGSESTSTSSKTFQIENAAFQSLVGFRFYSEFNGTKNVLLGKCQKESATPGTSELDLFVLDILPSETWVTITMTFNTTTNESTWDVGGTTTESRISDATALDSKPAYDDIYIYKDAASPVDSNFRFDNIIIEARSAASLSVNEVVNAKFSVFPNPSNGSDFVNFAGDNIQATKAEIFSLLGKKVMTASESELANKQINISSLAKGMYLLSIETPEGVATKKIIKN